MQADADPTKFREAVSFVLKDVILKHFCFKVIAWKVPFFTLDSWEDMDNFPDKGRNQ